MYLISLRICYVAFLDRRTSPILNSSIIRPRDRKSEDKTSRDRWENALPKKKFTKLTLTVTITSLEEYR